MDDKISDYGADRKVILGFFDKALAEHKNGYKAVSYGSLESQRSRFEALCRVVDLDGKSILDVGCGLGDLLDFICLERIGAISSYMGIDLNQNMIAGASERFSLSPLAEFSTCDLVQNPMHQEFDYVMESGIFNIRTPNHLEYVYDTLVAMYKACKCGVAANFLSKLSPFTRDANSYYFSPTALFDFAIRELSPLVTLRHDYRLNDFTIYVYRNTE